MSHPDDESRDPQDGNAPIPLWFITLCGLLLFWGAWYLLTYSGQFRGTVLDENPPRRFVAADDFTGDPLVMGPQLYSRYCSGCHQPDGRGFLKAFPPLAQSEYVLGNPGRLKRIVLDGLEGPVTVGGVTYNGIMPSFWRLSDRQLAAILTYLRTNQAWGHRAEPVSPESIAATRAAIRDRKRPWTATELADVAHDEQPATRPATRPATIDD